MQDKQVKESVPYKQRTRRKPPPKNILHNLKSDRPKPVVPSSPYGVDMQQKEKRGKTISNAKRVKTVISKRVNNDGR
jgi:hypothetical protein